MSRKRELEGVGHVSVRYPSVLELTKIINAQRNHTDRVIKCIRRDPYGRQIGGIVQPNNQKQIAEIMAPLKELDPDTQPVEKIIVYRSSSRNR